MLNIRSIIDAVHKMLGTIESSPEAIIVANEVRSLAHLGGQWTPEDESTFAVNLAHVVGDAPTPLPKIVPTILEAMKTTASDGQTVTPLTVAESLLAHAAVEAAPEPTTASPQSESSSKDSVPLAENTAEPSAEKS